MLMNKIEPLNDLDNTTAGNTVNTREKPNPIKHKIILTFGIAFIVLLLCFLAWKMLDGHSSQNSDNTNKKNYFSNSNSIICAVDASLLHCEDLATGELKEISLPVKFKDALILGANPNGSRILIELASADIVAVDTGFNEVRTVVKAEDRPSEGQSIMWADSEHILVSHISREQNDADFLPEPLTIRLINIDTGESRRIYKTGETVSVDSIKVLGSNDEFLFISYQTPKNWVAESTDPPAQTINAIRLSDGNVLPVNSHQTSSDVIFYDSDRGVFLSYVQIGTTDRYIIIASQLQSTDYGLALSRQHLIETQPVNALMRPVLTSKGLLLSTIILDQEGPLKLVNDSGEIIELKLKTTKFEREVISLSSMPSSQ